MFDFCNVCCLGKTHKLHSHLFDTKYDKPYELVFSDLWGPAHCVFSAGYKYYITFVDAYTRFTWIYFLKTKSEAFQIFNQFHTLITT